jgi:hypothetical protein
MRMRSYLENWAVAYGHLVELNVYPMAPRAYIQGWDITVIAKMPQKGITMKMKAGVILGDRLAVQADEFLETIGEFCYPITGSLVIIIEEEAADVYYLCAMCGHVSVDCPRL